MLELSQVRPGNEEEVEVIGEASLQFRETLRALGHLTSLHLSNVNCMDVLPMEVDSLTNLRCIPHILNGDCKGVVPSHIFWC